MKKTMFFLLALGLSLYSNQSEACTNFLVTKGASADGSTMITYAADSHVLYGELYHYPAKTYPEGTMLDIYDWDSGRYMGQIPQVRETYNVVGNMNEYQLAIGETTFGGLESLTSEAGIIDYGSLIYLTLQRAKNAREAIYTFYKLTSTYGFASAGESFSISDPNEAWILEMVGKGKDVVGAVWVARRIPDGYVSGHANQARITTFPLASKKCKTSITTKNIDKILTDNNIDCVYSADIFKFAKDNNYYIGPDELFSFSDVFNPVDFGGARFCDLRVWAMFNQINDDMSQYWDYATGRDIKRAQPYVAGQPQTPEMFPSNRMPLWVLPNKKNSVRDMMNFMRDHLEGTELDMAKDPGAGPFECPYRWRPMTWEVDGVEYVHERVTATQQTGFSFVAQSNTSFPEPLGGILWFGVDDAASTVYCPMFSCITQTPECFRVGNGSMSQYSETSAFWLFNQVSNWAYTKYNHIHPEIAERQNQLENNWIETSVPRFVKDVEGIKTPEQMVIAATNFSNTQADKLFKDWKNFYHHLLVKYIDGNVNTPSAPIKGQKYVPIKSEHPKYSEDFYRTIIKATGDKLKAY